MNKLIIAPHVDDELIGCFSYIIDAEHNPTDVLYLYEVTEERKVEAEKASQALGFNALFSRSDLKQMGAYGEVLVPSIKDWHADHKKANKEWRRYATSFYSVDMESGKYLGEEKSRQKKELLDTFYPSQCSLWDNNAKYYLFEDIKQQDYTVYRDYEIEGPIPITIRCTVRDLYEIKKAGLDTPAGICDPEALYNELLSVCMDKVTMMLEDYIYTID